MRESESVCEREREKESACERECVPEKNKVQRTGRGASLPMCEDRVLEGPASGEKGSEGKN